MNIYRIDTPSGPEADWLGVRLIRSYAKACAIAQDATREHGSATVTRITGGGSMKVVKSYGCAPTDLNNAGRNA